MKHKMNHAISAMLAVFALMFLSTSYVHAAEDDYTPAYENEGSYEIPNPNEYIAYHSGRKYYTSGKENGFRVNENNEESTEETIGILTFVLAPAAIIYMNLVGWWD